MSRRASSSSSPTTSSASSVRSGRFSVPTSPDKEQLDLPTVVPAVKAKPAPPEGTVEHVVSGSETLESISAKFDSTPSELVKINKLALRMVFPGQRIFIPDKSFVKVDLKATKSADSHRPATVEEESDKTSVSSKTSLSRSQETVSVQSLPKSRNVSISEAPVIFPGHIEAIVVPDDDEKKSVDKSGGDLVDASDPVVTEVEGVRLDEDCHARFLKINAALIIEDTATTDAGNVSGVLLVTPNAIMFDPNVSDPLVVKNGTERYGTIIPMENILSSAIYSEIIPRKSRKESRAGSIPFGTVTAEQHKTSFPFPDPSSSDQQPKSRSSLDAGGGGIETLEEELLPTINDDEETVKGKSEAPQVDETTQLKRQNETDDLKAKREAETAAPLPPGYEETSIQRAVEKMDVVVENVESDGKGLLVVENGTQGSGEKGGETGMARVRKLSPFRGRKTSTANSSEEAADQGGDGSRTKKGALAPLRKLSRSLMGRDSKSDGDASVAGTPGPQTGSSSTISDGILSRTGSIRGTISPRIRSFVDYSSGLFNAGDAAGAEELAAKEAADRAAATAAAQQAEIQSPIPGESFTTWQLRRGLSREELLQHASARRQKFGYRSLLTMDDKPELFRSIEDIIPHHTQTAASKPLYLCFRVGAPLNKSPRAIHAPVESYGKKKLKPEYWFAIEREKADKFYGFLLHWKPEVYGTENMDPAELGFMLFDEPDERMHEHFAKELRGMAKEWEVIAFDEALRRAYFLEREESILLPELRGKSDILNDSVCKSLVPHLPARAQGYPWTLIYSTSAHGFSLKTLYRKMQEVDSPTLFLIKDVNEHVFGAIISCAFKVAEHFYGTGESCLFTFHPIFRVYNWSGENQYIVRGQLESLAIGSGDGGFGVWLDGDIDHGRTQECTTFDNEPLCTCGDFQVKNVEAWCFFTD